MPSAICPFRRNYREDYLMIVRVMSVWDFEAENVEVGVPGMFQSNRANRGGQHEIICGQAGCIRDRKCF